ncbi:dipeptidyl peptidase 3 isoform X2 [Orussus abietinus]|nr:dipeptidyl peptidase 3 isoform X2 [Orussus abietinus]XP_012285416.1 dipeptidyl peptidase 3 isoform X2 [Orussus abietinus]
MSDDITFYTLPNEQPIAALNCEKAFALLTERERLYAHYLCRAAWNGGLVVLIQTSPVSPWIFALLHKIVIAESMDILKQSALDAGVTENEFTAFLVYICGILANSGNYKSLGDSKIIPNLPKEKFEAIIKASKAYKENSDSIENIWNKIQKSMYSLEGKVKSLGLGDKGITTYFSANCTTDDAELVKEFLQKKDIGAYNTRCFKTTETWDDAGTKKERNVYEIRLASIEKGEDNKITLPEEIFQGAKFKVTRGDYSELLEGVVSNLKKAKEYAGNETEILMLEKYIDHFSSGSLNDHKDGSRYWIKNKAPAVETYIGFIETYRDPVGQRAEFEGFVAMVNREMSKKFQRLVEGAEKILTKLPWGKDFEKDQFLKPDFTSLDILAFAGSGIPSGINIPNYDEIRQSEGFKNVSLGNVLPAYLKQDELPFLTKEDQELMDKYKTDSFELQIGLHELLGHGSGKLFRKELEKFNFDREHLKNPLTGKLVDKYYIDGETYDFKFGALGSSYEECRAEAVGLYLCLEKDILEIFGHTGQKAKDIIYVNWLWLLWTGCGRSLEQYQPETKTWLQAHAQARYVLLKVCLEAGKELIVVDETEPGKNLLLTLHREKIPTVGKKAIEEFLMKLQVYKSTGDVVAAKKLYDHYSEVPESGHWRDIVLAHKQPRKLFAQPNTFVGNKKDNEEVKVKHYEPTFNGLIQSWVERFPSVETSDNLIEIAQRDEQHFAV